MSENVVHQNIIHSVVERGVRPGTARPCLIPLDAAGSAEVLGLSENRENVVDQIVRAGFHRATGRRRTDLRVDGGGTALKID
ncbi:hypothetical protein D3C84_1096700 [compost metagenome]